jgi:acetyl-CoA acetyltransferase
MIAGMPVHPLRGAAAIVGVADAVDASGMLDGSVPQLEARMIRGALADAGLTLADVDGVCSNNALGWAASMELGERLGIQPRWTDSTQTGGSSFEIHVQHAAAAIALGQADVIVVAYAATPRSDHKAGRGGWGSRAAAPGATPQAEWEMPHGLRLPMGAYALSASRHMHEFGTTSEQLASIAVQTREWAAMNPRARLQDRITVDDVLASPMEASPLHKLDCCLVTDGAGAIVLASVERARDLAKAVVPVLGVGTCTTHSMISQMPDLTTTGGAVSGREAFAIAGLGPADVDVVELYDSFTITVLLALEDLGFCPKGEGGPFVADGPLAPGGPLPANTNGGGLAYTHPGQYGMFLLVEAVRQLRGEGGPRQVPGAEVAIAHGSGGVLSAISTVVLGTEATL